MPTPLTNTSTLPSVSSQISGPVVFSWMPGLAGFSNCFISKYFLGSVAANSSALAIAPFMPFGSGSQHQLGAQSDQHLAPLHAHGLRHGQNAAVAARGRRKAKRYARVAAGRFDQGHSRLQCAPLFGVPYHGGADSALDRVRWIAPLDLGENGRPMPRVQTVDADQRRAADGLRVVVVDMHRSPLANRLGFSS